jgi:hypothetical protein
MYTGIIQGRKDEINYIRNWENMQNQYIITQHSTDLIHKPRWKIEDKISNRTFIGKGKHKGKVVPLL